MHISLSKWAILAACLLAPGPTTSSPSINLEDLVRDSDVVLVGKVVAVDKTSIEDPEAGRAEVARVEVSDIMVGPKKLVGRVVDVLSFPDYSPSITFHRDARSFFFLIKCNDYFELARGHRAVATLDADDRVWTDKIASELPSQRLQTFMKRIRAAKVRGKNSQATNPDFAPRCSSV